MVAGKEVVDALTDRRWKNVTCDRLCMKPSEHRYLKNRSDGKKTLVNNSSHTNALTKPKQKVSITPS
jgi:hypothetical protein